MLFNNKNLTLGFSRVNGKCDSKKYRGVADIPEEWACCESESNKDFILFVIGESKFCIRCLQKWKHFDFDPNLDYTLVDKKEKLESE